MSDQPATDKKQHIVVVGGTKGLGLQIARAAAIRGDRVTVAGRSEALARSVGADLGGDAAGGVCDLTDWESLRRFFDTTGPINHLVAMLVAFVGLSRNRLRSAIGAAENPSH